MKVYYDALNLFSEGMQNRALLRIANLLQNDLGFMNNMLHKYKVAGKDTDCKSEMTIFVFCVRRGQFHMNEYVE